jgi:hypothetical protein
MTSSTKPRIAFGISVAFLLATVPPFAGAQNGQIGPIDGAPTLLGIKAVSVPSVDRSQTSMLVDAGTLDTDGYTTLILNLAGRLSGEAGLRGGSVGAILIPDIDPFDKAFQTLGLLPESVEISVPVDKASGYFMAKQIKFDVGFPRYRVVLYNSTSQAATVSFFAYRRRAS